jgi:hypothetical protein
MGWFKPLQAGWPSAQHPHTGSVGRQGLVAGEQQQGFNPALADQQPAQVHVDRQFPERGLTDPHRVAIGCSSETRTSGRRGSSLSHHNSRWVSSRTRLIDRGCCRAEWRRQTTDPVGVEVRADADLISHGPRWLQSFALFIDRHQLGGGFAGASNHNGFSSLRLEEKARQLGFRLMHIHCGHGPQLNLGQAWLGESASSAFGTSRSPTRCSSWSRSSPGLNRIGRKWMLLVSRKYSSPGSQGANSRQASHWS